MAYGLEGSFCFNMRYYRKLRGYSQAEFAKVMNVSQSEVNSWENPNQAKQPQFKMIERIADVLGIHYSKLFEDIDLMTERCKQIIPQDLNDDQIGIMISLLYKNRNGGNKDDGK